MSKSMIQLIKEAACAADKMINNVSEEHKIQSAKTDKATPDAEAQGQTEKIENTAKAEPVAKKSAALQVIDRLVKESGPLGNIARTFGKVLPGKPQPGKPIPKPPTLPAAPAAKAPVLV